MNEHSARLARCDGFQWDSANSAKIWEKHRVSANECEEVLFNQPLIVGEDDRPSSMEERFYALGRTDAGRLLFAAFTIRENLIRVISARDMSRRERRLYLSQ